MAKLIIRGAWIGVLEVELNKWTVPILKDELAKRSNSLPNSIKLICAGRVLTESQDNPNLAEIGLENNAKIMVFTIEIDEGLPVLEAEYQHFERIALIKKAVPQAVRTGLTADFLYERDQSYGMVGLILHSQGRKLIRLQLYKEAIQRLEKSEEAFSLCTPKFMKNIINLPILHLDIVWCFFMLQDTRFKKCAAIRVNEARKGLYTNWKDPSIALAFRFRAELSVGVAGYHFGMIETCRKLLTSSLQKLNKIKGYKETEAEKHAENAQRKKEIKFEHKLAAESVRTNESDTHNNLSNPEVRFNFHSPSATRMFYAQIAEKRRRTEATISKLVSMGFRSRVISIIRGSRTQGEALVKLVSSQAEIRRARGRVSRKFYANLAGGETSDAILPLILRPIENCNDFTKEAEVIIRKYLALLDPSSS